MERLDKAGGCTEGAHGTLVEGERFGVGAGMLCGGARSTVVEGWGEGGKVERRTTQHGGGRFTIIVVNKYTQNPKCT